MLAKVLINAKMQCEKCGLYFKRGDEIEITTKGVRKVLLHSFCPFDKNLPLTKPLVRNNVS